MKKLWLIFICVLFLVYGCGKIQNPANRITETTKNPNEGLTLCEQHAADQVTLDWYVNYSWFTVPWGENVV